MRIIEKKTGELHPYERNPRNNDGAVDAVAASIREFGFKVPVVIDTDDVIIAGHTRVKAAKKLGLKTVPCIVADDLTPEQVKAFRLADNRVSELADWDFDLLKLELDDLSMDMTPFEFPSLDDDVDMSNLSARVGEKDDDYNAFVDKFKTKATTDDCFTPPEVYEAVKDWVLEKYGIDKGREIIRPFYPGGDYQNYEYPPNCIVIDNPPFSIMSEITNWYCQNKIDFFLFANHMTLFTSLKEGCNAIVVGANVTYENGAKIATSFLTNLGGSQISVSASLHDRITSTQSSEPAELKAYDYPDNVISGPRISMLAKNGIDFDIKKCIPISKLDDGTGLYGKGALISDYDAEKLRGELQRAEILKVERLRENILKAEKLRAEKPKFKVTLSERERELINSLNESYTTEDGS